MQHRLEASAAQVVERRGGPRMPQQRLRRHHDERFARIVLHLTPERMKVLRRRRGIDHLHVSFRAQGEESLQARAGVLRSLSLVSMRKQEYQPAVLPPL